MDLTTIGMAGVAAITVICYLAATAAKQTPLANKWLPTICGTLGGVLGVLAWCGSVPDFPAGDPLTALAVGIVSGLAATGTNQLIRQLKQPELNNRGNYPINSCKPLLELLIWLPAGFCLICLHNLRQRLIMSNIYDGRGAHGANYAGTNNKSHTPGIGNYGGPWPGGELLPVPDDHRPYPRPESSGPH